MRECRVRPAQAEHGDDVPKGVEETNCVRISIT